MSVLSFIGQASGYYGYDHGYPSNGNGTDIPPAVVAIMMLFMLIFIAALYVVHSYFLGRLFRKVGIPSWKAWVPVYSGWVMLELGGQQGFWAILLLIPIVNIAAAVFMYIAMYHIGLRFGKEGVFVLLAIFLPLVWLVWLAVDHSTWDNGSVEGNTDNSPPAPTGSPDSHSPTSPPRA